MDLPQAAAQKGMEDGGLGAHCDKLQSPVRGAHAHMSSFAGNMSSLAKICQPQDCIDMVMRVAARLD